jgi:hypothetical protein
MRRLIVTAIAGAALVLTATALAVLPTQRTVFKGVTSEHAVNGYKPVVKFTSLSGGRQIKFFYFETLGCFGHGRFPVGTDPFSENPWRLTAFPVSKDGTYSAKVRGRGLSPAAGTMTATVTGSFTSVSKTTGKITFSQAQEGATCGPQTIKFSATAS